MSSIPNSYIDDIRRIVQSILNQLEHLKVRWLTGVERINNAEWSDVNYGVTVCTSATRPTGYDGRTIYETDTEKLLVYNGVSWVLKSGGDAVVSAQVTDYDNSIPDDTPTIIQFPYEVWDTDGIHDSVNWSRLTCKTQGLYLIIAAGKFDPGPAGERRMRILKTGALGLVTDPIADITRTLVTTNGTDLHLHAIVGMLVNHYVELEVTQKSGVTLTFAKENFITPFFTMHKLSDI